MLAYKFETDCLVLSVPSREDVKTIGPDPFKPVAFRAFIWDEVPGAFPSPVFDIVNMGAVPRDEGEIRFVLLGLRRQFERVIG